MQGRAEGEAAGSRVATRSILYQAQTASASDVHLFRQDQQGCLRQALYHGYLPVSSKKLKNYPEIS